MSSPQHPDSEAQGSAGIPSQGLNPAGRFALAAVLYPAPTTVVFVCLLLGHTQ